MGRKPVRVSVGDRFGRLVVTSYLTKSGSFVAVLCDCGKQCSCRAYRLVSHDKRSCGCLRDDKSRERAGARFRTHGFKGTPEYSAWDNIKQRCFKPSHKAYHNYGGRGISMCPEWACSFMAFFDHVGYRPSRLHSIDRIDNNGNYEPGNVKWSTSSEQAKNRRQLKRNKMGQYISDGQRNHATK